MLELIAFPIGHASTTLTRTLDQLTAAFSTIRPTVERSRASRGASSPVTDHNARTHDYSLFKSMLDSLTDLAQSRLLGIIRNEKRLVDALPGGDRHQTHMVPPPTHHQAAHQQGGVSHTHRTRTTRAPENIAITSRWRCREFAKQSPDIAPSYLCPYRTVYPMWTRCPLHALSFFLSAEVLNANVEACDILIL
jgi:hypothetical protein